MRAARCLLAVWLTATKASHALPRSVATTGHGGDAVVLSLPTSAHKGNWMAAVGAEAVYGACGSKAWLWRPHALQYQVATQAIQRTGSSRGCLPVVRACGHMRWLFCHCCPVVEEG